MRVQLIASNNNEVTDFSDVKHQLAIVSEKSVTAKFVLFSAFVQIVFIIK